MNASLKAMSDSLHVGSLFLGRRGQCRIGLASMKGMLPLLRILGWLRTKPSLISTWILCSGNESGGCSSERRKSNFGGAAAPPFPSWIRFIPSLIHPFRVPDGGSDTEIQGIC